MVRDVKQASFRLNADDTEKFKIFCEESEMTAAQGFSVLLEMMELDRAGRSLPARRTEIENFEQLTKSIVSAFLHSLELNENAENRIREQFSAQLETQTRTITDYQTRATDLELKLEQALDLADGYRNELQVAMEDIDEATKHRTQAETNYAALKAERDKQIADKENIISMLTDKLMTAEEKAAGYDDLKTRNETLQADLTAAEQTIRDNIKDAEIKQERALNALERKRDKERQELQELHTAQVTELRKELLDTERQHNEQIRALDKEIAGYRETIADLKRKPATKKRNTKQEKPPE